MSDLDRIFAEELSDADQPAYVPGILAGEAANGVVYGTVPPALARARTATHFSSESQPLERSPMSASLRRRLRREDADAVNDRAIEDAKDGNRYAREYLRDTLEGKPGVRIADGEWNPESAQTFNIMAKYAGIIGLPVAGAVALEAGAAQSVVTDPQHDSAT